jgi:hypothetical protein
MTAAPPRNGRRGAAGLILAPVRSQRTARPPAYTTAMDSWKEEDRMVELVFGDVRRIVLGLLFVVAFGWMAALVMPGADEHGNYRWQEQVAQTVEMVPPRP